MSSEKEKIPMDVAEEPVREMPNVEELLKILIDLNLAQEQQGVHLLMNYMNDVEENFYNVLEELNTVKDQLHQIQQTMQNKTLRERLTDMAEGVSSRVSAMGQKLEDMRTILNEKAGQVVRRFKEHGATALNQVCKTLGIQDMMRSLKEDLEHTAADMQTSIDKIDKVSQELRETATHTKNIVRALSGKGTLATPEPKESGFFYQVKRPYQGMKRFCLKKAGQIGQGIEKLERLEQNAANIKEGREQAKKQENKPSIMEKLNSYQKEQAAKAQAVAQNKKKENVR